MFCRIVGWMMFYTVARRGEALASFSDSTLITNAVPPLGCFWQWFSWSLAQCGESRLEFRGGCSWQRTLVGLSSCFRWLPFTVCIMARLFALLVFALPVQAVGFHCGCATLGITVVM